MSRIFIFILMIVFYFPNAWGGAVELSAGFSFNRSNYTQTNYTWSRKWLASVGYYFSERSQVEFAIQDIVDRTKISSYEDITLHDQIYSVSWVQALLSKNAPFQPYIKLGVGQLNRDASGTYADGSAPPLRIDSVTGVLGAGTKIYLTRTFALRAEAVSYLAGGSIRNWKNNVALNFGASYYF